MGMSVALVIAAFVWWHAGTAGTSLAGFGLFVFLGMASGFLGDLFMAGLIVPKPRNVIFGILFSESAMFSISWLCRLPQSIWNRPGKTITLAVYLMAAVIFWLGLVRTPREATMKSARLAIRCC